MVGPALAQCRCSAKAVAQFRGVSENSRFRFRFGLGLGLKNADMVLVFLPSCFLLGPTLVLSAAGKSIACYC